MAIQAILFNGIGYSWYTIRLLIEMTPAFLIGFNLIQRDKEIASFSIYLGVCIMGEGLAIKNLVFLYGISVLPYSVWEVLLFIMPIASFLFLGLGKRRRYLLIGIAT